MFTARPLNPPSEVVFRWLEIFALATMLAVLAATLVWG